VILKMGKLLKTGMQKSTSANPEPTASTFAKKHQQFSIITLINFRK